MTEQRHDISITFGPDDDDPTILRLAFSAPITSLYLSPPEAGALQVALSMHTHRLFQAAHEAASEMLAEAKTRQPDPDDNPPSKGRLN